MASVINLDKPTRHDIRGHLNDIYIVAQTLKELHKSEPDTMEWLNGQMKSVELCQELLDLTIKPGVIPLAISSDRS